MIPASSFVLDGDTALVVKTPFDPTFPGVEPLNRPCDTCGGFCRLRENAADPYGRPCPDCDGTGRHTFDIEVDHDPYDGYFDTFRVHVIDVLPIVDEYRVLPNNTVVQQNGDRWMVDDPEGERRWITLPPDAAPGKWLVRMAVH